MSSRFVTVTGRYILQTPKNVCGLTGDSKPHYSHRVLSQVSASSRNPRCSFYQTRIVPVSSSTTSVASDTSSSHPSPVSVKTTNILPSTHVICNHDLGGGDNYSNDFTQCDIGTNASAEHFGVCGNCSLLGSKASQTANLGSYGSIQGFRHRNVLQSYQPFGGYTSLDTNWVILRTLHTSTSRLKDESIVEKTVKALKDEVKQKIEKKKIDQPKIVLAAEEVAPPPVVEEAPPTTALAPPKKSIGQRIVAEIKHYYNGFKLLFIDVKVCVRLVWLVVNGKSLDRRERRQLVRTTADLFRLVPFAVFIIIPFMEFLLPVALKLFPGMLPSTFKEENKEQEKIRKRLKVKLEMAKFLQDTIEETALQRKGAKGEAVQEFVNFMEQIRTTGMRTSNEAIKKYSKLFEDEITLDNLEYGQLRALCNLLEISTVGTSYFLRFQLRMKLRQLETDDQMIQKEGVDSLAIWELQEACRKRGMRSLGVPESRLKFMLSQWLDLHLNEQIPTSLLLLSRTLYLPEHLTTEDQLKATIVQLPGTTAEEAKVKISEVTADRVDNKAKLEIIKQEEEAIRKEKEEEARLAAVAAEAAEAAKVKELEKEEVVEAIPQPVTPPIVDSAPVDTQPAPEELLVDKAPVVEAKKEEVLKAEEEEISAAELEEFEEVLEQVAHERKEMSIEKEELEALKQDVDEYHENLEDLKEVVLASGGREEDIIESKGAQRLKKKVNKMIGQMDGFMGNLRKEKDAILEEIEVKEVRIKRSAHLKENEELRQEVLEQISEQKRDLISINELLEAMRRLQKVPDDTKFQRIVQVLDEDHDGKIDINDALKVIELLGSENVKVKAIKMTEIMDLLKKEQDIEDREKEEKKKKHELEKQAEEDLNEQTKTDMEEKQ